MRIVRNLITINNKLRVSVGQRMASAPLELKAGPCTFQSSISNIELIVGAIRATNHLSDHSEGVQSLTLFQRRSQLTCLFVDSARNFRSAGSIDGCLS